MKKIMLATLVSVTVLSAFSAFGSDNTIPRGGIGPAKVEELVCNTAKTAYNGGTTVSVQVTGDYTATISGSIRGGEAMFIENIGPVNTKISYEGDEVIYSNSEEGVELHVLHSADKTTATFKDGKAPSVTLGCSLKNV